MDIKETAIFRAHEKYQTALSRRQHNTRWTIFWLGMGMASVALSFWMYDEFRPNLNFTLPNLIFWYAVGHSIMSLLRAFHLSGLKVREDEEILKDITRLEKLLDYKEGSLTATHIENVKYSAECLLDSLVARRAKGEISDVAAEEQYGVVRAFGLVDTDTFDEFFGY